MVMLKKIAAFCTVVMLVSCAGTDTSRRAELPVITWPGGNEIQRIRFVNTVSSPADIGITPTAFEKVWNFIMGEPGQFIVSPYGIETDPTGRMYVVDTYLRTVHVFDGTKSEYHTFETDDNPFLSPIDLAIDTRRDTVFVTDSAAGLVRIFTDEGETPAGELGAGELERPTGVAVNTVTDELLVVDTKKNRVYRYDLDTRALKGFFGSNGSADGKFNFPTNISATRDGTILVTDSMNFRVQMFTPAGEFKGKFGRAGDTPGFFSKPRGVATDSDGNIYVVDALHDSVQIFNDRGRLLMDFGMSGYGYGRFWLPSGIHIDENDTIYVADTFNNRIQVFQYLKTDQ
jgi:DNA-binding beta-propeller fold protein YncE